MMSDIIPFRRNGDIIVLLPLLKRLAEQRKAPVPMVVAPECRSLLEGVSYVEAVDENAPAPQNGAIHAGVFHRGLVPTTVPNGFAELAWHRLGHKWDATLPLVFDRRDKRREARLAKYVFRTDKPKLLLKLKGNSSPLEDADTWERRFLATFCDQAEVVCLDRFKADRIYDLIGLMDRAACMVTVDTSTLWLAHASKCPTIALAHPLDCRASPARGNCLLRVRYPDAEAAWPEIEKRITEQIKP